MSDQGLLRAFEDASLSPADFRHRDHIFVAWTYLQAAPFGAAGQRFCENLRRFAETHGKTTLFHETITWAYVALIHERMDGWANERMNEPAPDFDVFAAANPDIFDHASGPISRIYDKGTLASERARRIFLLPRAVCTKSSCTAGGSVAETRERPRTSTASGPHT